MSTSRLGVALGAVTFVLSACSAMIDGSDYTGGASSGGAITAVAGPDQTVEPGALVTLDASASIHSTGVGLRFAWEQTAGAQVTLADATRATTSFTAPSEPGTLTFVVRVESDDGAAPATDTISVVVGLAQAGCAPTDVDHLEAEEETNDETAEASGLVPNILATTEIGGCFAGSAANEVGRDDDRFAFSIASTTQWLVGEFERDVAEGAVSIDLVVDEFLEVPLAWTDGTKVSFAPVRVSPGSAYSIHVNGAAGATGSGQPYRVRLWTVICAGAPTTSYSESADGASNRGNDVYSFDSERSPQYELTAATTDAAEPTSGIAVGEGELVQITGNAVHLPPSGDPYLDRDAFRLVSGEGVTHLLFTFTWASATDDLDAFATPLAGSDRAWSFEFEPNRAGSFGVAVAPLESVDFWIGAADIADANGTTYTISACGIGSEPP